MPKPLGLIAIGLVLGTGLGFLLAAGAPADRPRPRDSVPDNIAHDHQGPRHHTHTETNSPYTALTTNGMPIEATARITID